MWVAKIGPGYGQMMQQISKRLMNWASILSRASSSRLKQPKMCWWASEFTQTGKPVYKTRCDDCHNKYLSDLRKPSALVSPVRHLTESTWSRGVVWTTSEAGALAVAMTVALRP